MLLEETAVVIALQKCKQGTRRQEEGLCALAQEHSGAALAAVGLGSQMWTHGSPPAAAETKAGCFTAHGPLYAAVIEQRCRLLGPLVGQATSSGVWLEKTGVPGRALPGAVQCS